MANSGLKRSTAGGAVSHWRAPQVLLTAAVRSSSLLGHDLINRFRAERYELFLSGHFALWASAGVVLPLLEYVLWYRTPYVLLFAAVGAPQCVALAFGLRLARLGRYAQSISLVCVTNWIGSILVTVINPNFLAAMAMLARLLPMPEAVVHGPRWLETLFIVIGLPFNAFHILIIVWNNAAALRTSEAQLAERAAELVASRSRLTTAADEERRRLERDLHDGAQQHLVALSVLIQLARKAEPDRCQTLLAEAAELVEPSIVEIRRLAHGIYP